MSRAPRAGAGGIRLAWRGLWFRRSTALIVLVLATVASAASVIAPLYSRAAEESILRDTLNRADAFTLSVQVSVPLAREPARASARRATATSRWTRSTRSSPTRRSASRASPTSAQGQYPPTAGPFKGAEVVGQVVERDGICEHLPVVDGRCPTAEGEAMVDPAQPGPHRRQDRRHRRRRACRAPRPCESGTAARACRSRSSARSTRCRSSPPTGPAGRTSRSTSPRPPSGRSERAADRRPGLRRARHRRARPASRRTPSTSRCSRARSGSTTPAILRQQVRRLSDTVVGLPELTPDSKLPAALARADDGRELVRIAAPLAVTQLVLLSWWTLYLVVGSATEERSPELGLAKLRGLTAPPDPPVRAGRDRPAAAHRGPARHGARLPRGTRVGPHGSSRPAPQVLLHLVGAAHRAVRPRRRRRDRRRCPRGRCSGGRCPTCCAGCRRGARVDGAGLVDGVVARAGASPAWSSWSATAAAGRARSRCSRPGMVAVAGGLLAARLLVRVARRRYGAGAGPRPGRRRWPAGPASPAAPARPGSRRCSRSPPACCSSASRPGRSPSATGSSAPRQRPARQVVLQVRAAEHAGAARRRARGRPGRRLRDGRRAGHQPAPGAEPARGRRDPGRPASLDWGAPEATPSRVACARPCCPRCPTRSAAARARSQVTVDLQEVESPSPLRLTARLDGTATLERVDLGELRPGSRTYAGELPAGCTADGCRLAALAVEPPRHRHRERHRDPRRSSARARAGRRRRRPRRSVDRFAGAEARGGPGRRPSAGREVSDPPGRSPAGRGARSRRPVRRDRPRRLARAVARAGRPEGSGTAVAEEGGIPVAETTGLSGTVDAVPDATDRHRLRAAGRSTTPCSSTSTWRCAVDRNATPGRPAGLALPRRPGRREGAARRRWPRPTSSVLARESRADLERVYAGDGAVLALRLLLVCGAPPSSSPSARCSSRRTSAAGSARTRSRPCAWSACVAGTVRVPAAARERRHGARRAGVRRAGGSASRPGWCCRRCRSSTTPSPFVDGALRARRRRGLGGHRRARPAPRRGRPRGRRPAAAHRSPRPAERVDESHDIARKLTIPRGPR